MLCRGHYITSLWYPRELLENQNSVNEHDVLIMTWLDLREDNCMCFGASCGLHGFVKVH